MRPKAPGLKYLITYHKVSMLNFPDSISQIINKPSQITLANFRKKKSTTKLPPKTTRETCLKVSEEVLGNNEKEKQAQHRAVADHFRYTR